MPKLNDTQTILLSTAAQRSDRSVFPLPDGLKASPRVSSAVAALLKTNFAEERETGNGEATSRTDGDLRYGVFATLAGLAAIGVEEEAEDDGASFAQQPACKVPRSGKSAAVLARCCQSNANSSLHDARWSLTLTI